MMRALTCVILHWQRVAAHKRVVVLLHLVMPGPRCRGWARPAMRLGGGCASQTGGQQQCVCLNAQAGHNQAVRGLLDC